MKTQRKITELISRYPMAVDTISFPVRYDEKGQTIWDADNMMLCDVRGWTRIQYRSLPEKRQDEIGYLIAELLNDFGAEIPQKILQREHRKISGEELDLFI